MTGPEHYQHAEHLLDEASNAEYGDPAEHYCVAVAQVHATLALAAATATGLGDHWEQDRDAWYRTASEAPGEYKRRQAAEAAELAEFAQEATS